jgi:NACHT N-terminal Helical domain 7
MSRKRLSYEDAVKLLGGESRLVAAVGKLAAAGLSAMSLAGLAHGNVPAAVGMFELKDEIVSQGQETVKVLRQRLTGLSRFKRSELLEAAHAVLVVSAFFAALDDLDAELRTALNSATLDLSRPEQVALATVGQGPPPDLINLSTLADELISSGRIPGLLGGLATSGRSLLGYYESLGRAVCSFAVGTAAWDERDETTQTRWVRAVTEHLPRRALARYEEQVTRLAGEFPEFAFWAYSVGVHAVLGELAAAHSTARHLGESSQAVAALLASAARGQDPVRIRSDLTTRYRHQVAMPVAGAATGNIPGCPRLPALRDLYVNPSYKTVQLTRAAGIEQLSDPNWQEAAAERDLTAMVLNFLISTEAAHLPLVLLGQPGAGKSTFTQILAASLDPRDYMVVRVELRAVPSDTGIQEQIEAAVEDLTGRAIRWPDFAESAGKAQPVILLDGFDELLQASGVSHADYLERIQAFQDREAGLGRPVAVLLTSRTAVASQVRYPDGTPVARLEEFDPGQVGAWLGAWNQANPGRPLTAETALAQGELARQPLLLFLLAFFHSGGGDLDPGISQARLYERLFTSFVERDVRKLEAGLGEQGQLRAVQQDLDYLSMVAFAMFNRGRQSVTEDDLIADLTALQPSRPAASGPAASAAALSIAERIAGRFFFRLLVHRDQAVHGQQTVRSTYEFLHASFGEFLIARWVVTELSRLGEQARRAAEDLNPPPPDDAKLYTLLSVTVLSTREQRVLGFIAELLGEKDPGELTALRELTGQLFRACLQPRSHDPYPQYRPGTRTAPALYAAHSANLLLLLLLIGAAQACVTGQDALAGLRAPEVTVTGSFASPFEVFHPVARLWHSQLTPSEWESLLRVVRVRPGAGGALEVAVSRWTEDDYQAEISAPAVIFPQRPYPLGVAYPRGNALVRLDSLAGRHLREAALLGARGYRDTYGALLPYIETIGRSGDNEAFQTGPQAATTLSLLIPALSIDVRRARRYHKIFGQSPGVKTARLLLEQLSRDIRRLPATHPDAPQIAAPAVSAAHFAWANINAYLDVLAQVQEILSAQPDARNINVGELLDPAASAATVVWEAQPDMLMGSPLDLASPSGLLTLLYSSEMRTATSSPHDLHDLLRLPPPHANSDPRETLGIRGVPELIRLIGILDLINAAGPLDPLALRELHTLNNPGRLEAPEGDTSRNSLARIALWAGLTRRKLTQEPPPPSLEAGDVARLAHAAPEFVSQTRRLASDLGFLDPLPQT